MRQKTIVYYVACCLTAIFFPKHTCSASNQEISLKVISETSSIKVSKHSNEENQTFLIAAKITNNTSTNILFNKGRMFLTSLVDEKGIEYKCKFTVNLLYLLTARDFSYIEPNQSIYLTSVCRIESAKDLLFIKGSSIPGESWMISSLMPGKYQLSVEYEATNKNLEKTIKKELLGHSPWQGTLHSNSIPFVIALDK